MPTADKFEALGMGNGFPFCPQRLDVENWEHWTTLGGTNKNNISSLSENQKKLNITESLKKAMELFWLSYNLEVTFNNGDVTVRLEQKPSERVCVTGLNKEQGTNTIDDSDLVDSTVPTDDDSNTNFVNFYPYPIKSFYSGGEFIGYGASALGNTAFESNFIHAATLFLNIAGSCRVLLGGATNDYAATSSSDISDIAYVTFAGLDLVCYAEADNFTSSGGDEAVGQANAANLFASCDYDSKFRSVQVENLNYYDFA